MLTSCVLKGSLHVLTNRGNSLNKSITSRQSVKTCYEPLKAKRSHDALWLERLKDNSVNNALTSRFQSTYDDDNIDDDDVSIWPPIHLLILKALRIIALHYVDTH